MFSEREKDIFLNINKPLIPSNLEDSENYNYISKDDFKREKESFLIYYQLVINLMKKGFNDEAEKELLKLKEQYEKLQTYSIKGFGNVEVSFEIIFNVLNNLSILSCKKNDYAKGEEYYNELVTIHTKQKLNFFNFNNIYIFVQTVELQKINKMYDKALDNLFRAIKKIDPKYLTGIYQNIADIYNILGNQSLVIEEKENYYNLALDNLFEAKKHKNFLYSANIQNDISNTLVKLGDQSIVKTEQKEYYNSALTYQKQAIILYLSKNDKATVSDIYLTRVAIHNKLNNSKGAEKCFKRSLMFNPNNKRAKEGYFNFLTDRLEKLEITKPELTTKRELKKYNSAYKSIQDEITKYKLFV